MKALRHTLYWLYIFNCMSLPSRPKKELRPIAVTTRLSKKSAEQLKTLAKEHNISQADVLEYLIQHEFKEFEKKTENSNKKSASNDSNT